jgi:hypothetical protein
MEVEARLRGLSLYIVITILIIYTVINCNSIYYTIYRNSDLSYCTYLLSVVRVSFFLSLILSYTQHIFQIIFILFATSHRRYLLVRNLLSVYYVDFTVISCSKPPSPHLSSQVTSCQPSDSVQYLTTADLPTVYGISLLPTFRQCTVSHYCRPSDSVQYLTAADLQTVYSISLLPTFRHNTATDLQTVYSISLLPTFRQCTVSHCCRPSDSVQYLTAADLPTVYSISLLPTFRQCTVSHYCRLLGH